MQRQNVRASSSHGPRRSELPNFLHIGELSENLQSAFQKIIQETDPNWNDLYGDHYRISKECPLKHDFPTGYRQILLQGITPGSDGTAETDYTVPIYPQAVELIRTLVPQFYRARLAELAPQAEIDWHIDTDTSISCRITALISGQCEWSIRRRGEVEVQAMRSPQIWFNNTGWPHRVSNTSHEPRWCLLLGTNYDSIAHYF